MSGFNGHDRFINCLLTMRRQYLIELHMYLGVYIQTFSLHITCKWEMGQGVYLDDPPEQAQDEVRSSLHHDDVAAPPSTKNQSIWVLVQPSWKQLTCANSTGTRFSESGNNSSVLENLVFGVLENLHWD